MNTPTEVEARFETQGRIMVLSFTWGGQRLQVTSTGRQWEAPDGRHVLVMDPGERVFELLFAGGAWSVARAPASRA